MFLYYWSDACPIMGSGLLDYYRKPYEVYEAMKAGIYPGTDQSGMGNGARMFLEERRNMQEAEIRWKGMGQ